MFSHLQANQFLTELTHFCETFKDLSHVKISSKMDSSPLTDIDRGVSDFFKQHSLAQGLNFYSEEDHHQHQFPALILDPLDGTRDFIEGRPECTVSAAWMMAPSFDSQSFSLLYNPFTGFHLHSFDRPAWTPREQNSPWLGLVSRSEWNKGLFKAHTNGELTLEPKGSIAFKLGLMCTGGCDFVVSLRPKNVWDIAAGTLQAHQRGFEFWSAGKRVSEFSAAQYGAPLIWARPHQVATLLSEFSP